MTTPNAELAYRVLDYIDRDPKRWIQRSWVTARECGTAYCFAGWALKLTGHELVIDAEYYMVLDGDDETRSSDITLAASRELGIRYDLGDELFAASNSRKDLSEAVAEIFGPRPAVSA